MSGEHPLLQIEQLQVCIANVALLRHVSLRINQGEIVGLVGESGSGKSLTALSMMGLLDSPPMHTTSGQIRFAQYDILGATDAELQHVRGNEMAMIFQEPMTSLNPVFTVGDQIIESLQLHTNVSRSSARVTATELMERVGIVPAAAALGRFPHQLSGGQRQRVMIAMAIACKPKLLIADEPTTALDVTVQAQILELLNELRRETNMSIMLIAHDLGVVRHYCDRVAVMYCGQIVEEGPTADLFAAPQHPYTAALLKTIPAANPKGIELPAIPGDVPPPDNLPPGCAFSSRCSRATDSCRQRDPVLTGDRHAVRCWLPVDADLKLPDA